MNRPLQSAAASGIDEAEWQVRVQLAACYRLFDHLGWTELIFNHITARVPGTEHFLINPFGLRYDEVTASNLVKLDLDGNVVGHSDWPFNPAGYPLHSAIHAARPDVGCVAHTHTDAGMAIACLADGLGHDNFYSAMLYGQVGYHDFEGITVHAAEKPRMVASLGSHSCLILRNHGLVAVGRDVAECFSRMWTLERACQIQWKTMATGGRATPIAPEVAERCGRDNLQLDPSGGAAARVFDAMVRTIDAKDPGYRN